MVQEAFNPDFHSIVTPIDVGKYHQLLIDSAYDKHKAAELVQGFKFGFDLGYRGPERVKMEANNLKLRVGTKVDLWNKVIKEVKEKRFAGGFRKPPFEHYIQSPLGDYFMYFPFLVLRLPHAA